MIKIKRKKLYTDEDIINLSKEVKSMAGLLKSLGLKPLGGNYANMKIHLSRLNIDCSHWTGQAWNKGFKFKEFSGYKKTKSLKPHLINERGHKCEKCLNSVWNSELITLEVHHIDGEISNNEIENLQLLCPNCHAQTENWRGRKNLTNNAKPPKKTQSKNTKINWPTNEELRKMTLTKSISLLSIELGVSRTAIRKRLE